MTETVRKLVFAMVLVLTLCAGSIMVSMASEEEATKADPLALKEALEEDAFYVQSGI